MEAVKQVSLIESAQETAKGKMAVELTKQNLAFQKIQDKLNSLEFTEENVSVIKEHLIVLDKMEKSVVATHAALKRPLLDTGKGYDNAKNDYISIIDGMRTPVKKRHDALCEAIDKRKREADAKAIHDEQIKKGIESNLLTYSQLIANCLTRPQLVDIERKINLEKTRRDKYGEFFDAAIQKFDEVLLPILKQQKIKVTEKEELDAKIAASENPIELDELQHKQEIVANEILQNQVKVQEQALHQEEFNVITVEEVLPDISPDRTEVAAEIENLETVFRKTPHLLKIELRLADAKKIGQALRDDKKLTVDKPVTIDGIKYSLKRKW